MHFSFEEWSIVGTRYGTSECKQNCKDESVVQLNTHTLWNKIKSVVKVLISTFSYRNEFSKVFNWKYNWRFPLCFFVIKGIFETID